MKNKVLKIIITSALLLITIMALVISKNGNKSKKEDSNNIYENINVFTNRVTLKSDECVYLGNNLKELDNGFFDICIKNKEEKLIIIVNSLSKNKVDIIESEYINELVNYIKMTINSNLDEIRLNETIRKLYIKLRSNLERFRRKWRIYRL